MDVNKSLALHLILFYRSFSRIEDITSRLEEDLEKKRIGGSDVPPSSLVQSKTDAQEIFRLLKLTAPHAKCSIHYLDSFVLSSMPTFKRLRTLLFPSRDMRDCRNLRERGQIKADVPSDTSYQ